MKKIFTILFFTGLVGSTFAQSNRHGQTQGYSKANGYVYQDHGRNAASGFNHGQHFDDRNSSYRKPVYKHVEKFDNRHYYNRKPHSWFKIRIGKHGRW